MVLKNRKSKIYAFIDSQNLYQGIKNLGWKLDFVRFRIFLKDRFKISKAYLFVGYIESNKDLYLQLKKAGYILIFKPTLIMRKGISSVVKGNVDAELVLHTMIQFRNFDKAIIVSADGDFHCLIKYLKERNKLRNIIIPNRNRYSSLLKEFREYFYYLDTQHKILENKKREGVA